jgi:heptosyltransferase-1
MKNDIQKIAIVRLSALGDIINSAVVLQFIHAHYPNAKIDWITEEMFASVLKEHPLIDKLHTINLKKFKKEKKLNILIETIKQLRSLGNYDKIIDMQGLIKSAIVTRVIGKESHGFDKNSTRESLASLFYKTSSTISYETNVVKRNTFVVGDALGFSIDDPMIVNKEKIFPIKKEFSLSHTKKNIIFVIGASWESKIYPKELIAKVCEQLKENAYIIWGSDEEKKNAEWIVANSTFAKLAPKLSLSDLISYISHMDLVIGNDTGPTHMAWAQNVPSITLFGPTNQRMIYETATNIGIKSPSKVNILKIDKLDFSIKEIPVDTITKNAKELLYGL